MSDESPAPKKTRTRRAAEPPALPRHERSEDGGHCPTEQVEERLKTMYGWMATDGGTDAAIVRRAMKEFSVSQATGYRYLRQIVDRIRAAVGTAEARERKGLQCIDAIERCARKAEGDGKYRDAMYGYLMVLKVVSKGLGWMDLRPAHHAAGDEPEADTERSARIKRAEERLGELEQMGDEQLLEEAARLRARRERRHLRLAASGGESVAE